MANGKILMKSGVSMTKATFSVIAILSILSIQIKLSYMFSMF